MGSLSKAGRMRKKIGHKMQFREERKGTRVIKRGHKKPHKTPRCKNKEKFYKRVILGREVGNRNELRRS